MKDSSKKQFIVLKKLTGLNLDLVKGEKREIFHTEPSRPIMRKLKKFEILGNPAVLLIIIKIVRTHRALCPDVIFLLNLPVVSQHPTVRLEESPEVRLHQLFSLE